jgi:hypothetical protein
LLRGFWKSFRRAPKRIEEPPSLVEDGRARPERVSDQIRRRVSHATVQVGLDFGTSATKATYRILGAENPQVRPILFRHKSANYLPFCLPSLGSFTEDGQLLLGIEADAHLASRPWGEGLTRFKMLVAGDQDARYLDKKLRDRYDSYVRRTVGDESMCSPEALAATYLAYAMRVIRRELAREVQATTIDISFNTCVPIDQRENNLVFAGFQRVVATAERLEKMRDPNDNPSREWLEVATELLPVTKYDDNDTNTRLFLVPEAVASVAAYLVSLQKRAGIHALYDIGAGTTDLSVFNLDVSRTRGTTNFWYSARSIPMGTGQIEERLAEGRRGTESVINPEEILAALNTPGGNDRTELNSVKEDLTTIWLRTSKGWSEAFKYHLRKESEWRADKVQVFLAGGGASLSGAHATFRECPLMARWGPYPCSLVPAPDGYDSRGGVAPFARMSVAYGLSIPIPELEVNVMPSESPDHTPPPPAPSGRYTPSSDDEVIPKPGWV